MKKEYAVGNWFPSPIKQNNADNSIGRVNDTLITGEGDYGFKIKYIENNKYRVTGSAVNSIFVDSQEFTISASDVKNIWCKITFNEDGVATAASLTTSDPGVDTETQGSFLIGTVLYASIIQSATGSVNAISAGVRKQITSIGTSDLIPSY